MNQSKTVSFIEAMLNIGSGLILSAFIWVTIGPLFGYTVTWLDAVGFSGVFTVSSIIRSYIWRRLFVTRLDVWLHKRIHGVHYAEIRRKMSTVPPRVGSIQSLRGYSGVREMWNEGNNHPDAKGTGDRPSERSVRPSRDGTEDTILQEDKELR